MKGESHQKAVTSSQLRQAAPVAAEREVIHHRHQEVEAVRTTNTMANLAKKYLNGDEVVEVKLINRCYFSATLTILWSDLHVHVYIFNV